MAHRAVVRGGQVGGTIMHSDRGTQGGFNWSSQHLDFLEVCDAVMGSGSWRFVQQNLRRTCPQEIRLFILLRVCDCVMVVGTLRPGLPSSRPQRAEEVGEEDSEECVEKVEVDVA
jgi:hypothetical protein